MRALFPFLPRALALIGLMPENRASWYRVRQGLNLLLVSICLTVLLIAVLIAMGAASLAMRDNPRQLRQIMLVGVGAAGAIGVITWLAQMVGAWRCLAVPKGTTPRRWVMAAATCAGVGALFSLANALLSSGVIPGLPSPRELSPIIITCAISAQICSVLGGLFFVFFLGAIGRHFGQERVVSVTRQLIGLAVLLLIALGVAGFLWFTAGRAISDPREMLQSRQGMVIGGVLIGIGLLYLLMAIWYVRALVGARDAIADVLDTAAARFVRRVQQADLPG